VVAVVGKTGIGVEMMSTSSLSLGTGKVLCALACTIVFFPWLWWVIGLPFSHFAAGRNALWYVGVAFGAYALLRAVLDVLRRRHIDVFTYIVWTLLIQHALTWGTVRAVQ